MASRGDVVTTQSVSNDPLTPSAVHQCPSPNCCRQTSFRATCLKSKSVNIFGDYFSLQWLFTFPPPLFICGGGSLLVLKSSPWLGFADCSPMVPVNALLCFSFLSRTLAARSRFVTLRWDLPHWLITGRSMKPFCLSFPDNIPDGHYQNPLLQKGDTLILPFPPHSLVKRCPQRKNHLIKSYLSWGTLHIWKTIKLLCSPYNYFQTLSTELIL